jgi:hypothetical protein
MVDLRDLNSMFNYFTALADTGYDGAYAGLMHNGLVGGNNWSHGHPNRWQKPGDITNVPRISNNFDANVTQPHTGFLLKPNYLSANNVRIGYTLPGKFDTKNWWY